jgi:hypothetical protein
MDRDTLSKLRLDRRLIQRRGWISSDDLEREIEALPDVSGKIGTPAEEAESAESAASDPLSPSGV